MRHLLIEYRANDMLPGDWAWYVATYKIDRATGGRAWVRDGRLAAAIYEFPERFRSHCIVPIQYTPSVALAYGENAVKSPSTVRWGVIIAIHDSLIKDIGEAVFAESALCGSIKTRDGGILADWKTAILKKHIHTPIGQNDSPKAFAARLTNDRMSDSDRYSLILREDVAWKLSSARFPGCRIHWVERPGSKRPNKAPEPTPTSVMPRANERRIE